MVTSLMPDAKWMGWTLKPLYILLACVNISWVLGSLVLSLSKIVSSCFTNGICCTGTTEMRAGLMNEQCCVLDHIEMKLQSTTAKKLSHEEFSSFDSIFLFFYFFFCLILKVLPLCVSLCFTCFCFTTFAFLLCLSLLIDWIEIWVFVWLPSPTSGFPKLVLTCLDCFKCFNPYLCHCSMSAKTLMKPQKCYSSTSVICIFLCLVWRYCNVKLNLVGLIHASMDNNHNGTIYVSASVELGLYKSLLLVLL